MGDGEGDGGAVVHASARATVVGCQRPRRDEMPASFSSARTAHVMNPVTDPYYAGTFQVLVDVDRISGR